MQGFGRRSAVLVAFFLFASWNLAGLWAIEGPEIFRLPAQMTAEDWFRKGISSYREGAYDEAIAHLERSLKTPTGWEEYPYYYLLESHRKAAHTAEALGLCKAFRQHFPQSHLLERLEYVEAQGYQESSAYWLACRAYESLLESRESAEVRLRYGEVLEELERFPDAYANYQRVREKWPRSEEAHVAKGRVRRIAAEHPGWIKRIPRVIYLKEEADLCLSEGAYTEALSFYRELQGLALSRHEHKRIRRDQILALTGKGQLQTAHGVLRSLMREYPGSKEVAEGLLAVGKAYWGRNRNREAFPVLKHLLEQYTDTEQAMRAAFMLGRIHFEEGNLTEAIRQYRETRFLYPDTRWEEDAAWGQAWCHYLLGQYGSCAEHLQECVAQQVWDAGMPRALYWEARCLERAGKIPESQEVYAATRTEYPESYYSLLAEWRLSGKSLYAVISPDVERVPRQMDETREVSAFQKLADPALPLLVQTGLLRDAAARLDWLRNGPQGKELTAKDWVEAYCQAGDYLKALRLVLGKGLLSPLLPNLVSKQDPEVQRLLQLLYPLPSRYDIQGKAQERGLDPFLVAGLIHQESVFMEDAVSRAGAVGLMQIMPETGRRVAKKMGFEAFRAERLHDPEVNLRIGMAYLKDLANRYDEDWPKVLAAYNAGPRAVERWTQPNPSAEIDEFIEGIRYRETRIYVKKVLYNWSLYHRIHGSPPVKETSSDESGTWIEAG